MACLIYLENAPDEPFLRQFSEQVFELIDAVLANNIIEQCELCLVITDKHLFSKIPPPENYRYIPKSYSAFTNVTNITKAEKNMIKLKRKKPPPKIG